MHISDEEIEGLIIFSLSPAVIFDSCVKIISEQKGITSGCISTIKRDWSTSLNFTGETMTCENRQKTFMGYIYNKDEPIYVRISPDINNHESCFHFKQLRYMNT